MNKYRKLRQKSLTQMIQTLRTERGLNQAEIAKFIGCSRSRITNIEGGRGGYTLEELEILTSTMGVNPSAILSMFPEDQFLLSWSMTQNLTKSAVLGKHICPVPADGKIELYEDAGGPIRLPVYSHHITFSHDEKLVAMEYRSKSKDDTNYIGVWNTSNQKHVVSIPIKRHEVNAVAFSPDNQLVAYNEGGTVVVYNLIKKSKKEIIPKYSDALQDFVDDFLDRDGCISEIIFTPDGKYLVVYDEDYGGLRLWDTSRWKNVRTYSISAMVEKLGDHITDSVRMISDEGFGELGIKGIQSVPGQKVLSMPWLSDRVFFLDLSKSVDEPCFSYRLVLQNDIEPAYIWLDGGKALGVSAENEDGQVNLSFNIWENGDSWTTSSFYDFLDVFKGKLQQAVFNEEGLIGLIRTQGKYAVVNLMTRRAITLDSSIERHEGSVVLSPKGNFVASCSPKGLEIMSVSVKELSPNLPLPGWVNSILLHETLRANRKQNPLAWKEVLAQGLKQNSWTKASLISRESRAIHRMIERQYKRINVSEPPVHEIQVSTIPEEVQDEAEYAPKYASNPNEEILRSVGRGEFRELLISSGTVGDSAPGEVIENLQKKIRVKYISFAGIEKATKRDLCGQILGAPLKRGQSTAATMRDLENKKDWTLLAIDHAENMSTDLLIWFVTQVKQATEMVDFHPASSRWTIGPTWFITRDPEKFSTVIKEHHDPLWIARWLINITLRPTNRSTSEAKPESPK